MVSNSSSGVSMSRPTHFAPNRATVAITTRNANAMPSSRTASAGPLESPEHRLQRGEVQRQEHVLDHDDAEDQPALGIAEPAELDQQLGDDGRRRNADRAGDHERFLRAPPQAEPEGDAAADVEAQVHGTDGEQLAAPVDEVAEGELEPEVEQQQHQTEVGQQLDGVRVVEQRDARRVRTEQDARRHEERDGGQPDASSHPGEDGGGQERRAEGEQLVTHGSPRRSRR